MVAFQPLFNEYGVVRAFTVFWGWSLIVGSPEVAKEVFVKNNIFAKQVFKQSFKSSTIEKLFGPSQVVSNNGDEWKRHRKIINPIFNQTWNTQLFGSCAQDVIDEWTKEDGKDVKVGDLIQRMTLDVFGKAIFDYNFNVIILNLK
ncbi:hypothetical protein CONCODRAFT_126715 [Conidiobolus coronatus NRRL 28638]|uniref:Cytochrome P450 n=1 Tax=Conidiobolus coronatus (strain ATCC 28846 / CBS 209.66 / NRRL 28638) TaxID=796925 RepID=A0A137NV29_CONC2|nr:hypothetical protein CONCODRAFT_126715 [Conidiobolus coronatus NRRL 28638]|eukprot:KXN66521.1 hypothetical protein CONCODRAFT_126715 [Conidiobolus coronatus NRRL 28638]